MLTMGEEEAAMSLISVRRMTEKNLAAHRTNTELSRGAVTPADTRRAARANLRHGFYDVAGSVGGKVRNGQMRPENKKMLKMLTGPDEL